MGAPISTGGSSFPSTGNPLLALQGVASTLKGEICLASLYMLCQSIGAVRRQGQFAMTGCHHAADKPAPAGLATLHDLVQPAGHQINDSAI